MRRALNLPIIDRLALGLSGLCVIHCVLSVIMVSALSFSGLFLLGPSFHEFGLVGAILLAGVALVQGFRSHRARRPAVIGVAGLSLMTLGLAVPHGLSEAAVTIVGVILIAVAHLLNARYSARAYTR